MTELIVLIVLIVLVVAVVGAIVFMRRGKGGPATKAPVEAPQSARPEWLAHLERLVVLNIAIRENSLPSDVTAKLEETIDDLRAILPELNDAHPGGELTWTINRMASDYLPRIVDPFVKLGPSAREEHRSELLGSLQGLESELASIRELVRDQKTGEFKTKAAFLRARFLEGSLG